MARLVGLERGGGLDAAWRIGAEDDALDVHEPQSGCHFTLV